MRGSASHGKGRGQRELGTIERAEQLIEWPPPEVKADARKHPRDVHVREVVGKDAMQEVGLGVKRRTPQADAGPQAERKDREARRTRASANARDGRTVVGGGSVRHCARMAVGRDEAEDLCGRLEEDAVRVARACR
jgi:hypothetical protein